MHRLRVVVADDERPARAFLVGMLANFEDVEVAGEASSGSEAVELIERVQPDLALLDLQMPELDGLGVVRLLRKESAPLVAFVTAYDEYAVRAFELNAVDYLLKPVDPARLRTAMSRAIERLERDEAREIEGQKLQAAAAAYAELAPAAPLRRIPVRRRNDIVLLPVAEIASAVADGELLHVTSTGGERYVVTYRLKDLEARLDPATFIRLSRGTLVNADCIKTITPVAGGTYVVTLRDGAEHGVSRMRARVLREQLLKL